MDAALATMKASKIRRLPVVDGDGTLMGMLTMNDIVLRSTSETNPAGVPYKHVMTAFAGDLRPPNNARPRHGGLMLWDRVETLSGKREPLRPNALPQMRR